MDYNEMTGAEWVSILGERFRSYRMASQQTQQEVAYRSGVTVQTIRRFESGKACNITMVSLVSLPKSIGMADRMEQLLPEIPLSPYLIDEQKGKEKQRIRHKKR